MDGKVNSLWMYSMDILEETGLLNAKSVDTPVDTFILSRRHIGRHHRKLC